MIYSGGVLTSVAEADTQRKPVIAALKRCATQTVGY
jgi:hypothetical protein